MNILPTEFHSSPKRIDLFIMVHEKKNENKQALSIFCKFISWILYGDYKSAIYVYSYYALKIQSIMPNISVSKSYYCQCQELILRTGILRHVPFYPMIHQKTLLKILFEEKREVQQMDFLQSQRWILHTDTYTNRSLFRIKH